MPERIIKFNKKILRVLYRDDSDLSVIDEFFVDHMYRALEPIIPNLTNPIIDIGAHIGMFSIYSKILNQSPIQSGTKIIAIEPEQNNFKLLQTNLKLKNCIDVKTIRAALIVEKELSTKLYLSKNTHNHSTVPLSKDYVQVPAISLERLMKENKIKKIGLLKMDIEGAEFAILQSFNLSIFKKIQNLIVEYHESNDNKRIEIETLVRSHGFSVENFPNKFDKRFGLLVCRNKKPLNKGVR